MSGSAERTSVLVTGGTGLVGHAVIEALRDVDVVSLTRGGGSGATSSSGSAAGVVREALQHSSAVRSERATYLQGDVTAPRLGLDAAAYERLAAATDVVVHAAGVSDFTTPVRTTHARNVEGTRHVIALAEDAGAALYHVSTGYIDGRGTTLKGRWGAGVYLESKREAETLAGASDSTVAIVRPSIVWGDSTTGWCPSFQGLHRLVGMMFESKMPLLPFGPETRVDFVPCDTVGTTIADLVAREFTGEFWLTAGPAAMEFGRIVELVLERGAHFGLELHPPRFVDMDMIDRLVRPVGGEAVSRRVDIMLALTSHFTSQQLLPTSFGDGELPDVEAAFVRGVDYWAREHGYAERAEVTG